MVGMKKHSLRLTGYAPSSNFLDWLTSGPNRYPLHDLEIRKLSHKLQ